MSEQSLQALALANPIRIAGAQVRAEVTTGQLSIVEALYDSRAGCLPIGRLLCAQHYWGPAKANALLRVYHIWPTRRVRDLTDRQKQILAERLEELSEARRLRAA